MKYTIALVLFIAAVMAIAGPAETTADNLCSKYAPTARACAKW
jgi:hypothetical protein